MSCSRRVSPSVRSASSPDRSVRAIAPSISLLGPSDSRNDNTGVSANIQPRVGRLRRQPDPRVGSLSLPTMAVVPIRIVGDPVLRTATEPVPVADDGSLPADLADLIKDLFDTMDAANGGGLAAHQIGVSKRVFVYDCADERGRTSRRRGVVVNPVLETSEVPETMPDPDDDDEGCLSVPGESFPTGRADYANVTGLNADGSPVPLTGKGLSAGSLQRDTGPLDGRFYLDAFIERPARSA